MPTCGELNAVVAKIDVIPCTCALLAMCSPRNSNPIYGVAAV